MVREFGLNGDETIVFLSIALNDCLSLVPAPLTATRFRAFRTRGVQPCQNAAAKPTRQSAFPICCGSRRGRPKVGSSASDPHRWERQNERRFSSSQAAGELAQLPSRFRSSTAELFRAR